MQPLPFHDIYIFSIILEKIQIIISNTIGILKKEIVNKISLLLWVVSIEF